MTKGSIIYVEHKKIRKKIILSEKKKKLFFQTTKINFLRFFLWQMKKMKIEKQNHKYYSFLFILAKDQFGIKTDDESDAGWKNRRRVAIFSNFHSHFPSSCGDIFLPNEMQMRLKECNLIFEFF